MLKTGFMFAKKQQITLILENSMRLMLLGTVHSTSSCKTRAKAKATTKQATVRTLHLTWRVHILLVKILTAGL